MAAVFNDTVLCGCFMWQHQLLLMCTPTLLQTQAVSSLNVYMWTLIALFEEIVYKRFTDEQSTYSPTGSWIIANRCNSDVPNCRAAGHNDQCTVTLVCKTIPTRRMLFRQYQNSNLNHSCIELIEAFHLAKDT